MKRRKWAVIVFLVILLLGAAGASGRAQSSTTLSVLPASGELILNNTINLILFVTNGLDINGFDLTVNYDPAVLTLESREHGGYLSALHNFKIVDEPGLFRLVSTQLSMPGVSGDGSLLKLVFKGAANGVSLVTLPSAMFVNMDNELIYPVTSNGSLYVHSDPSLIPTHTLTGGFTLQGQSGSGGIPVSLGYGLTHWLGPFSGVTVDARPTNLAIPGVYEDSYLISTGQPRYLNLGEGTGKVKAVAAGSAAIAPLRLLGGNAVWQGEANGGVIDEADIDLILGQYHRSGSGLDGDVNFSGKVDIFDLALAAGNFELTSEIAYGDWIP